VSEILEFLVRHGPPVLFAWVFVDQAGIPLPAVPLLLVVGALVGSGQLSLWVALGATVAGCLGADVLWYTFGRRRGARVLGLLCRITLEPDSCVRRVEDMFIAYRLGSLVIAKFLPGLNPLAAALSGVVKVQLGRFVLSAAASALAWAATWVGLGYVFSGLIEEVAAQVSRLGGASVLVLLGLLGAYVGVKYVQRRRFLRALRIARISPEELKQRLDDGRETMVVDLRTRLDVQAMPYAIPGALRISADELEQRHEAIPRGVEIVLYCT
jgi:membrane protein DedA with SNARE-associated domain